MNRDGAVAMYAKGDSGSGSARPEGYDSRMFEAIELGRQVSKKEFDKEEPVLHSALLKAQRRLAELKVPVILVMSGVEGAGKGAVVNRLNKWLDTRYVRTNSFWDETDEETQRPRYWRFWRCLPPAGTVGIMFGSWYTHPIVDRVFDRIDDAEFEHEMRQAEDFERLLTDDGALIVKFWFHLAKSDQQDRLQADVTEGRITSPLLREFSKNYDDFLMVSERAIHATDIGPCRWHLVEAADARYRDLTVARTLLSEMEDRIARAEASSAHSAAPLPEPKYEAVSVLDRVDLESKLEKKEYEEQLAHWQNRVNQLTWKAREQRLRTVVVFEGWDAAGKGGAIRRLTRAIDARLFNAMSIGAPTDEEHAHHYLWRFWRHVPRSGYMTIYDRSWYGRVLVERVEGFAREEEWERAYHEINTFEQQLVEHGIVVLKFWLHISNAEQLRRFKEREQVEWKKHKITDEDWRNREKWDAYRAAVDDMVLRTSTQRVPWDLVPANDKRFARVRVIQRVCEAMEAEL